MQFGLSESQQILKDTARKFFSCECPIAEVRRLMETATAYDPALWEKLAGQGFTGIISPEEFGGMGLGKIELILLMEEAGYALLPGPFFSTVALAGAVIDAVASAERKKKYLARIAGGQACATVALPEAGASWDPADAKLEAIGDKLTGTKLFVSDAGAADFIVVIARNGVFAVDAKAPGLRIEPMKGMDLTRKVYSVQFSNTPAEKLGSLNGDGDGDGVARAFLLATTALAAEMVGGMQ